LYPFGASRAHQNWQSNRHNPLSNGSIADHGDFRFPADRHDRCCSRTAFFFVTLPEILPIAVITRFINWFHEFGIPRGGVIVKALIKKEQAGADTIDFVKNRIKMQEEHMKEIWEIFGDRVRAIAPLLETEIKGAKMLNRTINYLFVLER
jgi:anion-transporting  ArsA/GET3 family ATPase